jgi:hypothetical protein
MIQSPSHLDAYDEAPAVRAINGEVLLTGPHVDAAYTVRAARELAERILVVAAAVERQAGKPPRTRNRRRP